MMVVYFIILGLIVGSFINVLTFRLKTEESFIGGRSKCPSCRHVLKPKDLIPVISYLWLKGRCRYCQVVISKQYPLVELATAFLFGLIIFRYLPLEPDIGWLLLRDIIFTMGLIALFVFDFRWYIVPDQLTIPLIVFALGINLFLGFSLSTLAFGILVGGGFYLILWALSRGRWVGSGDIRLGVLMGAMLGWPGTLVALYLAYIVGGFTAGTLILSGHRKLGGILPMGTFLTIGTFVVLVFNDFIQSFLKVIF